VRPPVRRWNGCWIRSRSVGEIVGPLLAIVKIGDPESVAEVTWSQPVGVLWTIALSSRFAMICWFAYIKA
jgi:hypothetical protein